MDALTDASETAGSMRSVLADSGNNDVTVKVFANANHSLGEMPTGNRMAPGVFETLRSWLLMRVQTAERVPAPESNWGRDHSSSHVALASRPHFSALESPA
jgi:hypothetical protein